MSFDLGGLVSKVAGGALSGNAEEHFGQVASQASPDLLSRGLAAMFHSDQTPPFAQMAAQLFNHASADQKAGILNHLLGSLGPSVISALAAALGGGALGGLLSQVTQGGGVQAAPVTPEQAAEVSPEEVQQVASHAETHAPGVVDAMSGFFAGHPDLVKTLGSSALSVALGKMAAGNAGT